MEIEIINWEKYNPRKDVKRHSWMAISNRMIEDADIYELTGDEFKAWIYCLSRASQEGRPNVKIDFRHALRVAGITEKSILAMLKKMQNCGSVTYAYADVRVRTYDEQVDPAHVPYIHTNKQTDSGTDFTHPLDLPHSDEKKISPHAVVDLWNEKCEALGMPKILKLNDQRKKKLGNFLNDVKSLEDWQRIFLQASTKTFVGNDGRKFTPSFDYVLEKGRHISLLEEANAAQKEPEITEDEKRPFKMWLDEALENVCTNG